jgi:integrase
MEAALRVQRHKTGSVRFDKRRGTWNFLWYDGPTRRSKRIGTKQEFPTKAAAWKAVERLEILQPEEKDGDTVRSVIARYQAERMPTRHSTARVYRSFLNNHILPKWGDEPIQTIQPRPVELWLRELPLSPKSKTHVRSLMHGLVEFAMWAGLMDISRNPMSLVQNKGAMQKTRKARSLTTEQFHALLKELHEPFATLALLSVCLGLRISEALALQWADVDWLGERVNIRRGIV